ncbi:hypothetical protein J7L06_05415 [Candidatus Bathyarchaeota archaeon]|nr:hypothetical protein [Candidatus Bathyarchaeota archaeon]
MSPLNPDARKLSGTALCAALYFATILTTAYIPTGFIVQFRPAVVVPAVFAALMGPWVGGIGAAIGTFTASILRYGTPLLTVFSGTPGNFLGFWTLGYVMDKLRGRRHWTVAYIVGAVLYSLVSSFVIAVGLYFLAAVVGVAMLAKWTTLSFILSASAFQIAYKLFFTILLGPPIIKACRMAVPSLAREGER